MTMDKTSPFSRQIPSETASTIVLDLVKRLALLVPSVRQHIEQVRDLVRRNRELEKQLSELTTAYRSVLDAARPLGTFRPDARQSELSAAEKEIVERFHNLYYEVGQRGGSTYMSSWLGFSALKCPLDLWIYQELICANRPRTIIETGTASGGGALFLATICELVGRGQVISIDVADRPTDVRPKHRRLIYIKGSSTDETVIAQLRTMTDDEGAGMVILDSDHRRDHVLMELRAYQTFVPVGGYLVVEDTNINGHPTYPDFGPGPMEAVEQFLRENDSFRPDPSCERFLLTMNPRGFLRRYK